MPSSAIPARRWPVPRRPDPRAGDCRLIATIRIHLLNSWVICEKRIPMRGRQKRAIAAQKRL